MVNPSISPIQRFWRLLKPDIKEVNNIYIYSIFSGLISLSLPLGIQAIVNLIQGGQISTSWIVLVVFVVFGMGITGLLQVFQLRILENLQQKIFTRAAFEFSYRIPRIKMEALYKHYAPELMNRFFDITSVQKGLPKILIEFTSAIFIVGFSLILLSLYHPFFILFSSILIILIYIIFKYTAQRGLSTSLDESKYKYKVVHWLEEVARTNISFKMAANTKLPLQQTDKYVGQYLIAREGHFKVLVQQYALLIGFKMCVATGLLAMGGWLVMQQQMNIGQFIAAEIIVLTVMTSVEKLITSAETIYDILTSLEKISQVTDLSLDRAGGRAKDVTFEQGMDIELRNVSFNYPDSNIKVLNNVSLHVKQGEHWMLCGKNNSGKSTLISIIAGLYKVNKGSVLFNKLPIGNLSLPHLRDSIGGYMSFETLFEGTITENISLGRACVPFENVTWAAEKLGLIEFIQSLPDGYETKLNTEGKGLPKSIITQLLLARAIAGKPKLLLLENAFEHLNLPTSKAIIDFIMSNENTWSVIASSANAYMAQVVDQIIVMDYGEISKVGSYNDVKDIVNFSS